MDVPPLTLVLPYGRIAPLLFTYDRANDLDAAHRIDLKVRPPAAPSETAALAGTHDVTFGPAR